MTMSEFAEMMSKKYGITRPAEPPPTKSQISKTKPNKYENFFMVDLMILKNSLATRSASVRERLQKVNPYAWRDLRLLTSLVSRIQKQLIDTMPDSRFDYYSALARNGRYHLDIEGPVRQHQFLLVTDDNLTALCERAMVGECPLCFKAGHEIDQCMLRKALLEVAPPNKIEPDRCEYREAASELAKGQEVTV